MSSVLESPERMISVANRFLDAVETADLCELDALYHDDAYIWHNTIGHRETKAENVAKIRAMPTSTAYVKYTERRIRPIESGFCMQYKLSAKKIDGKMLETHGCAVCSVEDGRIVRLEEYLDSAPFVAWRRTD